MSRIAALLRVAALFALCCGGVASSEPSCGRLYVLKRGDYLALIAQRVYGRNADWRALWRANQAALPGFDPSELEVGTILHLPCDLGATVRSAARPEQRAPSWPARRDAPAPPPQPVAAAEAPPPAPPLAAWLGHPDDPAREILAAALAEAGLDWRLVDGASPEARLRAPLRRGRCVTSFCRGALWSDALREMTLLRFAGRDRPVGKTRCLSAGVAALRGEEAVTESCLTRVRSGEAASATLTDIEAERLGADGPRGLSERPAHTQLAVQRAAFAAGLGAEKARFDAALARVLAAQAPSR